MAVAGCFFVFVLSLVASSHGTSSGAFHICVYLIHPEGRGDSSPENKDDSVRPQFVTL
jgi:hypothetical protein